jgi:hypothetical protein
MVGRKTSAAKPERAVTKTAPERKPAEDQTKPVKTVAAVTEKPRTTRSARRVCLRASPTTRSSRT